MLVIVKSDYDAMSREAAQKVAGLIRRKPDCILGLATGTGAALCLPGAVGRCASGRGGKLNVVMIVIDDLNDYVTGMGGHPQAKTPHLAKLAAEGVSFRRAYSNNPVCAPSRGSFFTGIYPHTSKLIHFGKWFENEVLINSKTIPEYPG